MQDLAKDNPPLYPGVVVELSGHDGNSFSIIGRALKAARKQDVPWSVIREFQEEAMAGDYDHLIRVVMKYFDHT